MSSEGSEADPSNSNPGVLLGEESLATSKVDDSGICRIDPVAASVPGTSPAVVVTEAPPAASGIVGAHPVSGGGNSKPGKSLVSAIILSTSNHGDNDNDEDATVSSQKKKNDSTDTLSPDAAARPTSTDIGSSSASSRREGMLPAAKGMNQADLIEEKIAASTSMVHVQNYALDSSVLDHSGGGGQSSRLASAAAEQEASMMEKKIGANSLATSSALRYALDDSSMNTRQRTTGADVLLSKTNDPQCGGDGAVSSPPPTRFARNTNHRNPATPGAYRANRGENLVAVGTNNGASERDLSMELQLLEQQNALHPQDNGSTNQYSTGGLAVAEAVMDESKYSVSRLQEAEEYDMETQEKTQQHKRTRTLSVVGYVIGGALFCIVVVVILLLVFLMRKDDSTNSTGAAYEAETPSNNNLGDPILALFPEDTLMNLEDPESPQTSAYNWLINDPNIGKYTNERIIQRFALSSLYFATNGDKWKKNDDWLSYEIHECSWYATDMVNQFGIAKFMLTVPDFRRAPFFPFMDNLPVDFPCEDPTGDQTYNHLWFATNELDGTVPAEIFLLTSLRSIVLRVGNLEGSTISTHIGKVSKLEYITMDLTNLGGTIPTQIGLLSNLNTLVLSENEMVGPIPSQLGLLSNNLYGYVELSYNQLTGTVPVELGALVKLKHFTSWNNFFTGTIPSELGRMESLVLLSLSTTLLTGTIPKEIGGFKNIQTLMLGDGLLTGTIPESIWEGGIWDLSLWSNQLSDTLPTEVGLATNLSYVDLWNNSFTGAIPSEVGQLTGLVSLSLWDNQLSKTIPTEIGSLQSLEVLNLWTNELTGGLPSQLGLLRSLSSIELYTNPLGGTIPSQLGQWESMVRLIFAGNQLTGSIPSELASLQKLTMLGLWINDLTGTIPSQLGRLRNLVSLMLHDNSLSGSIPKELDGPATTGNLIAFYLHGNDFTGTISNHLCDLGKGAFCVHGPGFPCNFSITCSDALCGCDCPC